MPVMKPVAGCDLLLSTSSCMLHLTITLLLESKKMMGYLEPRWGGIRWENRQKMIRPTKMWLSSL